MSIRSAITSGRCRNPDGMSAFDPFLDADLETVQSGMTFNYGEFATIKIRIEYLFPDTKVFQCISVAKPICDKKITILGFQHIGNTDVVFGIDPFCPDFNAFYKQCSLSFHAIAPSKSATIASIALRSSFSRFTISAIFLLSA